MNIFYSLDSLGVLDARYFTQVLSRKLFGVKFGWEYFSNFGMDGVCAAIGDSNVPLFLDLKICDASETVYKTIKNIVEIANPDYLTLKLTGDYKMLEYAKKAISDACCLNNYNPTKLIGSIDIPYFGRDLGNVLDLASFAHNHKLDGVLCIPKHIEYLRNTIEDLDFYIASTLNTFCLGNNEDNNLSYADFIIINNNLTIDDDPNMLAGSLF